MNRFFAAIAAFVFAITPALAGQTKPATSIADVDAQLGKMLKDAHIPGASVALVENGKLVFAKGYGYADVAKRIPATADTPFRAGSISKAFTSIAILTLVEQHRLSLSEKLTDFAPDVHFVNPLEQTNPVRLANLLEHTTGWPDVSMRVLNRDEKTWSVKQGVDFSSSEFVSRWAPGRFMVYNNAGPAVAALALERASGQSFDDYLRDHVLRPMGMASADFALPPDLAARIAKSYTPDGKISPYQYIVLRPAGSLNVSARELAQLVRFYLADGVVDGRRILSPESVARIERSETNLASQDGFTYGYGLGNAIFPDAGPTFRGHNGQIDSFTSVMGYNRRSNSGFVVMANGGAGGDADFGSPIAHLIQSYLTRHIVMQPTPIVKLDPAALDRYTGFYRTNTPPNALLQPYLEILNTVYVNGANGKITLRGIGGGSEYFPVSDHLFRRLDREDPGIAFVEDGGDAYKLNAFSAAVKESVWIVVGEVLVLAALLLGAIIGIIMLAPWLYFAARGRLAERGGLLMRVAPLVSTIAFCALMAMPLLVVQGSNTSALHQLADVGPYSLTILAASIVFPVLALIGLILALRASTARTFVRGYVIANCAALLVVAAYLATIGWIPMQTWTM